MVFPFLNDRSFLSVTIRRSQLSPRAIVFFLASSDSFKRHSHWVTLSEEIPCLSASCFLVRSSRTSSSFNSLAYIKGFRYVFLGFIISVLERLIRRALGVLEKVRVYRLSACQGILNHCLYTKSGQSQSIQAHSAFTCNL